MTKQRSVLFCSSFISIRNFIICIYSAFQFCVVKNSLSSCQGCTTGRSANFRFIICRSSIISSYSTSQLSVVSSSCFICIIHTRQITSLYSTIQLSVVSKSTSSVKLSTSRITSIYSTSQLSVVSICLFFIVLCSSGSCDYGSSIVQSWIKCESIL